jgi:hypothetical protein
MSRGASGGRCVRDGVRVRRVALALRADAGPHRSSSRPAARRAGYGVRAEPGEPPDRLLVSLAVLGLLSEVAEEQPLVCPVDDVQWLDRVSAQTLAFVARRLLAERVGLVCAVRQPSGEDDLADLPELVVRGVNPADARALLDSGHRPLDERVRDRIIAETRGNPLGLLELPRGPPPAELAGGYRLPDATPLASRIEQGFLRRLEPLAPQTRRLLLTAAAERGWYRLVAQQRGKRRTRPQDHRRAVLIDIPNHSGARVTPARAERSPPERALMHRFVTENTRNRCLALRRSRNRP